MTDAPGPCTKCGSADTKRVLLKPPRSGGGQHRCAPECEQPFRLCLSCRVATPLKEGAIVTYELTDGMFGRTIVAKGDPFDDTSPYMVGDNVGPKFDNVAAAVLHMWSLESFQDETSGDAQYGNGWHALFRSERAILQAVNSGACYGWRVPDNEDIDAEWEKIEAGAVYPDDPDDNEE